MNKTEWIFVFNYDGGALPNFIRFITNKTKDEIEKNYGGSIDMGNIYNDKTGMGLIGIWYCDEYTEEFKYLGHNIINHGASYAVYELNDPALNVINIKNVPTVDLDLVLSNPTVDYGLTW